MSVYQAALEAALDYGREVDVQLKAMSKERDQYARSLASCQRELTRIRNEINGHTKEAQCPDEAAVGCGQMPKSPQQAFLEAIHKAAKDVGAKVMMGEVELE